MHIEKLYNTNANHVFTTLTHLFGITVQMTKTSVIELAAILDYGNVNDPTSPPSWNISPKKFLENNT